jgi:hypothetical protein
MHVYVMGLELEGPADMSANRDQFRQEFQFSVQGQQYNQAVVFDGKEMWIAVNDMVVQTQDKKKDLDPIREQMFAEGAATLVLLGDKSFEVSIIGEDKVGDVPVIGVRVSKKGHKDVSLYFDKETHLLKKTQFRGTDFVSGTEVDEQHIVDGYTEVDGEQQAKHLTIVKDDKKYAELELNEIKFVDKLDAELFSKPKK